jgi:cobalamin synthase
MAHSSEKLEALNDHNIAAVGISIAVLFFATAVLILGPLTRIEELIVAAVFCSPPVMRSM